MDNLLMVCAILLFTIQTLCFKQFNQAYMKNSRSYFLFSSLYCGLIAMIFLMLAGGISTYHIYTLLLGAMFGIAFVAAVFLYSKAMETGPMTYSILFFSYGLLIPILFGVLFCNETMGAIQWVGLILLLVTFYLGGGSASNGGKKINLRWLAYSVTAFICNGSLGALQKAHQRLMPGQEIKEFLVAAFSVATLISLALFLCYGIKHQQKIAHMKKIGILWIVIGTGLSTAFGNLVVLHLASRVPAVVLFPVVSGSMVVVSSICSVIIFKEKLARKGVAGLVIGVVAICLLNIK